MPWAKTNSTSSYASDGAGNNRSGLLAEDNVALYYQSRGAEILARRFRDSGGEVDLVLRQGREFVFVEVKAAINHDLAAARLTNAQTRRICQTALAFCARHHPSGPALMRFDLALVDRFGRVKIVQNAFGGW